MQIEKSRIQSIDIARGLVMVIMALDHTRDYFHITANTNDPLALTTATNPFLFFTRWITHFCAPTFVFLSGTSIFLQSRRKTPPELGSFLLKRGAWLVLMEWTIVAFAWTFDPGFHLIPFGVIWAIGMSMIVLGLLVMARIPYTAILILGIIIVFGHNLLDHIQPPHESSTLWWNLLHVPFNKIEFLPGHVAVLIYPFPVWAGVMMLGYCTGIFFTEKYTATERAKIFRRTGAALIILFIGLHYSNIYGNPWPWRKFDTTWKTILFFIDVEKYPPSLHYFCMTIGPLLIILPLLENIRNGFTKAMNIFGRTAFFYYVLHLYLIHFLAMLFYFLRGHTMQEALAKPKEDLFYFVVPGEGFGLVGTYLVWISVVLILYPICKKYNAYKSAHPEKKWLSYL